MSEKEKVETTEKKEEIKQNVKANPEKANPKVEPKEKLEGKQEEEFNKERAMHTIKTLREREKDAEKAEKELEKYKAAEKERKEAELSEMEILKTRAVEAENKYKELEIKEQKREIAVKVGLPDILALRIQGETLEDMQTDAEALLEAMPKKSGEIQKTNPGATSSKTETREETFNRMFKGNP